MLAYSPQPLTGSYSSSTSEHDFPCCYSGLRERANRTQQLSEASEIFSSLSRNGSLTLSKGRPITTAYTDCMKAPQSRRSTVAEIKTTPLKPKLSSPSRDVENPPFRIQLMSDLHLHRSQYKTFTIPAIEPYLALLGDIGTISGDYLLWLRRHLRRFDKIFLVLGNNEPYRSSWPATKAILSAFQDDLANRRLDAESLGDLIILDQCRFDVPNSNLTILGATLFTRVLPEQKKEVLRRRQEFRITKDWNIDKHNAAHQSDLDFLNVQVQEISREFPDRRILILTHYSPTINRTTMDPYVLRCIEQGLFVDHGSGFYTDLHDEICWRNKNVKCWAYGHTHYNVDICEDLDGVDMRRLVTNQAEDVDCCFDIRGFKLDFVLEI